MSVATETKVKNLTLYLIRHGKTPGNALGKYIGGRTDEGLSEEGIAELKAAEFSVEAIFVSPMKRAKETADILFRSPSIAVEDLREIDFGEFENKNYKELSGNSSYQAWIDSNGTSDFPGGESQSCFKNRVVEAFKKLVQDCVSQGKHSAAVVAHGGTVMSVMSHFADGDYFDYQVKNGEGYVLSINFSEEEIHVVSYDRISCRISA